MIMNSYFQEENYCTNVFKVSFTIFTITIVFNQYVISRERERCTLDQVPL